MMSCYRVPSFIKSCYTFSISVCLERDSYFSIFSFERPVILFITHTSLVSIASLCHYCFRCLTLRSVVGDDGDGLTGILQGSSCLFVCGVTQVHTVHLKNGNKNRCYSLVVTRLRWSLTGMGCWNQKDRCFKWKFHTPNFVSVLGVRSSLWENLSCEGKVL